MKEIKKPKYLPGADGIRALGVLGVIFYHLFPGTFKGGYLGVPLFFLLSGYLLTDHLIYQYQSQGRISYGNYFLKRVKSLYPALLVMFSGTLSYMTLFEKDLLVQLKGAVFSTLGMFNNWWQIVNGISYFDRYNHPSPYTHLWYLGVQGQLYLLLPFFLIFLEKKFPDKKQKLALLFALSLLSGVAFAFFFQPDNLNRSYYGTDTRAFTFILGMLLAYLWPSSRLKEKIPKKANLLLSGMGTLAILLTFTSFFKFPAESPKVYFGGMYLFSVISMVLLAVVLHPGTMFKKLFTVPLVKWLGGRSYEIYLWQYPMMIFYEAKISVANHPIVHGVVELFLILLVAELSYQLLQHLKSITPKKVRQVSLGLFVSLLVVGSYGLFKAPQKVVDEGNEVLEAKIKENTAVLEKRKEDKTQGKPTEETKEDQQTTNSAPVLQVDEALMGKYQLTKAELQKAQNYPITIIGDSVLLASASELLEVFPNAIIDGKVGRQVRQAPELITSLKKEGKLKDTVVLALGTNGPFNEKQFKDVMDQFNKETKVYWVDVSAATVRWQNQVNQDLVAYQKEYPNLTLIPWYQTSIGKNNWFYKDQVHPNPTGAKEYVHLLVKTILSK